MATSSKSSGDKDRRAQDGEDREVVAVEDGPEHGFIGSVRADKDRDAYTVAGVTGGTANVTDTPKSVTRANTTSTKSGS
jgi:hypothetical protein